MELPRAAFPTEKPASLVTVGRSGAAVAFSVIKVFFTDDFYLNKSEGEVFMHHDRDRRVIWHISRSVPRVVCVFARRQTEQRHDSLFQVSRFTRGLRRECVF